MSHIDTINKQFYDLPEKLQNLEINYSHEEVPSDSEDDTDAEKLSKAMDRHDIAFLGDSYLFFNSYKGFRTKLTQKEVNRFMIQYNEINSDNLRYFVENCLNMKKCN